MSHEKAREIAAGAKKLVRNTHDAIAVEEFVLRHVADALSALVPDEVAGVVERLRARTFSRWASDIQAVEYFEDELATEAADMIEALAARAEKAEREAEMQRELKEHARKCCDKATARITTLEAELSALRARLEEAGKVIERWVSWCDDWHAGKPHPSDDLAAARLFLEEAK